MEQQAVREWVNTEGMDKRIADLEAEITALKAQHQEQFKALKELFRGDVKLLKDELKALQMLRARVTIERMRQPRGAMRARVLEFLGKEGGPVQVATIADGLGVSVGSVIGALKVLVEERLVVREGRGLYRAATPPADE